MKTAKFVVAIVAAVAVAAQAAISDGTITVAEWFEILTVGLGAAGVWAVPNKRAVPPGL